jgi:polysaccharide biosynthesis protein PelD
MRRISLHAFHFARDSERAGNSVRQWAEALVLSALTCALILWLPKSEHTVWMGVWLALIPGFVGLKHGLLPGAVATLAWGVAILLVDQGQGGTPVHTMLPVGAAALAAGQARDHWHSSRGALRVQAAEQKAQLEQLFRAYAVLRASHAQLQERLAAQSWSLDSAVHQAEQQIIERDLAGAASSLLELLATQARVGAASLYLSTNGELHAFPVARIGAASKSDGRHVMVRAAWQRGMLVAIDRTGRTDHGEVQHVLIAVPLVTTHGRRIGVVAIHELPFVAFHDAHFTLLSALGARLADALADKLVSTTAPKSSSQASQVIPVAKPARRAKRTGTRDRSSDCLG